MQSVSRFLTDKLKLTVNEAKSVVAKTDRIIFLGYIFKGNRIFWSLPAFSEFKRRVRMCYWKQWRKCRTKVRELVKREVISLSPSARL